MIYTQRYSRVHQRSRRTFLKSLGAIAGLNASSWLGQRIAFADRGESPQRLILFPMINGAPCKGQYNTLPHQLFWPETFSALSPVTEPLMPYAQHLTFIRGMWLDGAFNHPAVRSIYTGAYIGVNDYSQPPVTVPSIDQIIADHINNGPTPTPLRSLHLAAAPADHIGLYHNGRSTFFFGDGGVPLDFEANPVTAYDRFFGGEPQLPTPSQDILKQRALEIIMADINSLHSQVATLDHERRKLERYRDVVQDLQRDIPEAPVSCGALQSLAVNRLRDQLQGSPEMAYRGDLYPDIVEAQFDIMAQALVCGMTRVATLQTASADNSQNAIAPVEDSLGRRWALHAASHHPEQLYFGQVQRWFASQLTRFLQKLDVPDPLCPQGRTVLDNSVVLWMSEAHPIDHGSFRLPMAYIGSAGGRLRTGMVINHDPLSRDQPAVGGEDLSAGPSHKNFLKTICRAFGVEDSRTPHLGDDVISEMLV